VTDEHPGSVVLRTPIGGRRILDLRLGEALPRICGAVLGDRPAWYPCGSLSRGSNAAAPIVLSRREGGYRVGGKEHLSNEAEGLHKSNAQSTDGACLFHYFEEYKANSCCYRWQGKKDPRKDHTKIYKNYLLASQKQRLAQRGIAAGFLKTNQYATEKGGVYPPALSYDKQLALPTNRGDWDLDGPRRKVRSPAASPSDSKAWIKKDKNFTTAYWPYWNNAHHLIPKALFRDRIEAIEDAEVRTLVEIGLFRGEYNINYYKNVVFLPMDEEVARALCLPRHLTLQGPAVEKTGADYADHSLYTAVVKSKLQIVVNGFVAAMAPLTSDFCEGVKTAKLSKEQLEALSESCFQKIRGFGRTNAGAPLNDIPSIP
jgi:hypothetical protein